MRINDLGSDLCDGILLINLLEVLSGKVIRHNKKPKSRAQMLDNNAAALQFLKDEGIKIGAIGPAGTLIYDYYVLLNLLN